MVFDIPPRGTAVKLQETLTSHKTAICELEAQGGRMVSSDEEGNIILWQSGGHFTEIIKIDGKGLAVTSFFLSEVNFTFLRCCWCTIQQKKLKWKMFFCQVKYNKFLKCIFSSRFPCSTLCLYKDFIIGGFATGHIRVFNVSSGALCIEACAHARWINAMDISVEAGLVRKFFLLHKLI